MGNINRRLFGSPVTFQDVVSWYARKDYNTLTRFHAELDYYDIFKAEIWVSGVDEFYYFFYPVAKPIEVAK